MTGGVTHRGKGLTREHVLEVTLALAEAEGLEAVSMRRVARELQVTPMALYRHVGDKQGLLDGLVERLLEDLPLPDPQLDWRARLLLLAGHLRASARRRPDAFMMLLRRPAVTPAALRRRDAVYDALRDAAVPEPLVARTERLLTTFVLGFAASEAAGRFGGVSTEELDADLGWALEQILEPLLVSLAANVV